MYILCDAGQKGFYSLHACVSIHESRIVVTASLRVQERQPIRIRDAILRGSYDICYTYPYVYVMRISNNDRDDTLYEDVLDTDSRILYTDVDEFIVRCENGYCRQRTYIVNNPLYIFSNNGALLSVVNIDKTVASALKSNVYTSNIVATDEQLPHTVRVRTDRVVLHSDRYRLQTPIRATKLPNIIDNGLIEHYNVRVRIQPQIRASDTSGDSSSDSTNTYYNPTWYINTASVSPICQVVYGIQLTSTVIVSGFIIYGIVVHTSLFIPLEPPRGDISPPPQYDNDRASPPEVNTDDEYTDDVGTINMRTMSAVGGVNIGEAFY